MLVVTHHGVVVVNDPPGAELKDAQLCCALMASSGQLILMEHLRPDTIRLGPEEYLASRLGEVKADVELILRDTKQVRMVLVGFVGQWLVILPA